MSNQSILRIFLLTSMAMLYCALSVGSAFVFVEALACVVMSGLLIGKTRQP